MTIKDEYHSLLGQSISMCWLRFIKSFFQKIISAKFSVNRCSVEA